MQVPMLQGKRMVAYESSKWSDKNIGTIVGTLASSSKCDNSIRNTSYLQACSYALISLNVWSLTQESGSDPHIVRQRYAKVLCPCIHVLSASLPSSLGTL